jgi:hypothetical protein
MMTSAPPVTPPEARFEQRVGRDVDADRRT